MFQDWGMYNNFSRFVLVITLMAFIGILVFDMYLLIFNAQIMYQSKNLAPATLSKIAKVSIDFGDGQKRYFEGEVLPEGLTLADVLSSVSEAGELSVGFSEKNGLVVINSIGNLSNSSEHYWELSLPKLNWSKRLDEIDVRQSLFVAGTTARLLYK